MILIIVLVRPTDLNISGVEHHVVQGTKVTLECVSRGARPPAVITWANDSTPLPAEQTLSTSELQVNLHYYLITISLKGDPIDFTLNLSGNL